MKKCGAFTAALFVAGLIVLRSSSALGATLTVTNTNDTGSGSLRAAIQFASPGDTIVFQIGPFDPGYNPTTRVATITLFAQDEPGTALVVGKALTIDGAGSRIVLKRNSVSGTPSFRLFRVNGGNLVLSHLTLTNGYTRDIGPGGAILNQAGLTVQGCTFVGNSSRAGGGAISNTNAGTVLIASSTFVSNAVIEGNGGAISNSGALTLRSCTIFMNSVEDKGGGVYNAGLTTVSNTIVAGNLASDSPELYGIFTSQGYNIIGNTSGSFSGFGVVNGAVGDQIGASNAQLNLGPLQNNGGPTDTLAPGVNSVAIDKGKSDTTVALEQRDKPRPVDRSESNATGGDGADIGAVENGILQGGPTYTVNNYPHHDNGCTSDDCTLVEAIVAANSNANTSRVVFAPEVSPFMEIQGPATGLAITAPVNISGPGSRNLTISGGNGRRIFDISIPNVAVTISGLMLTSGRVANSNGGAISNTGALTLVDCTIRSSVAVTTGSDGNGGGLFNAAGATANLNRCTFLSNHAGQFGGGIFSDGILTVTNSTFSLNTALRGGGLISRSFGGASMMTLRNCTITQNSATDGVNMPGFGGGGVYAEGGSQQYFVANNLIAGNISTRNPDVRGNFTSQGHNLIGDPGDSNGLGVNADKLGAPSGLDAYGNHGGPTDTWSILETSPARDAGDDSLADATDQRGLGRNGPSDIGAYEFAGFLPVTLANISTRLRVETGNNVLIGGFIITGTQPKKVIIRAIGPSLPVAGQLANPTLELFQGSTLLASNDDWQNQPVADRQAVIDSTVPPANDLESALVRTLPANGTAYTAIVRGVNDGTGIGVIEAFDLDRTVDSKLANISTRGLVQTGDNVLIAGTIVLGSQSQKVIVRAIGPSLPFPGTLANPTLELRDANGGVVEANDDWINSPNKQAIIDSTVPPANDLESAIVQTLPPAAYTAVVRGVTDTTGIAVVEVFALQ